MGKKTVAVFGTVAAGVLFGTLYVCGAEDFVRDQERFELANYVTSAQEEAAQRMRTMGGITEVQLAGMVANINEPDNYLPKEIRELAMPEEQAKAAAEKVFQESCADSRIYLDVSYGTVGTSVFEARSGRSMMVADNDMGIDVYLSREKVASDYTGFSGFAWNDQGQFAKVEFTDPAAFVSSLGSLEWQSSEDESVAASLATLADVFTVPKCGAR